jgi:predicted GNAT family N-acyltransferase
MIKISKEKYPNQDIYLHSQCHAKEFYEAFGFKAVGEIFKEANIDHCYMILKE